MNSIDYSQSVFERIKHVTPDGNEFWYARELQTVLGYEKWDKFQNVIDKARIACENSGAAVEDHFPQVGKMITLGKNAIRDIGDIALTRYACYLIAQNGDPRKDEIALAQNYFAIQTRRQELQDQFGELSEDQKRIGIRSEMREHNKRLVDAAKDAGVETSLDYAVFQDEGYKGLYGGLTAKGIHAKKQLKKSQKILDYMGSEELAANLFRATQTESKLRREHIQGKQNANYTHNSVGKAVRSTIKSLGGTMPEDLPTPQKSVKQLERDENKRLQDDNGLDI